MKVFECVVTGLEEQIDFTPEVVRGNTMTDGGWNCVVRVKKVNEVGRSGIALTDNAHHGVSVVFHYY
jgi:hypothetical protein